MDERVVDVEMAGGHLYSDIGNRRPFECLPLVRQRGHDGHPAVWGHTE